LEIEMVAPSPPANIAVSPKDERESSLLPLLFVLTVVTGLVDAVSYLKLGHVFVANMTGNVVFLGFAVAGAPDFSIPASLVAIAAFMAGALAGGRLGSSMPEHRTRLLAIAILVKLVLVGAALVVAMTAADLEASPVQYGLIALLALAMGLQNAAARVLAVPDLTTTVLTLTLTGLAADSTLAGGSNPRAGRRLLATGAMFLGAAIGALLVLKIGVSAALALTFTLLGLNAIAACLVWLRTKNAQPSSP
jgi:uncharacterized membrane protein YoaK (UPF0700 family)